MLEIEHIALDFAGVVSYMLQSEYASPEPPISETSLNLHYGP